MLVDFLIWAIFIGIVETQTIDVTTAHPSPSAPRPGVDFLGPLWLPRTFKITCCRGGVPKADNERDIANWTQTVTEYASNDNLSDDEDDHCKVYEGSFLLSAAALFNISFTTYGVQCRCPAKAGLSDNHCRRLPQCQNHGYRSQSLGMHCSCPEPFFGEVCERSCDQGQVIKGVDGRNYCSCLPFYQGEECRDMVCLNGGVEINGRCTCPSSYIGYHCEVDANRSSHSSDHFRRYGGSGGELIGRDVSGTIFSLIMIIVLVVSMYLLMKHRMQSRLASNTRGAPTVYALTPTRYTHTGEPIPTVDVRITPFISAGIEGPPPYVARLARGRARNDDLPPLPSYEDATKDVPDSYQQAMAQSSVPPPPTTVRHQRQPPESSRGENSRTTEPTELEMQVRDSSQHNHTLSSMNGSTLSRQGYFRRSC